ncbi:MAG: ABC transporter ATP-binding protein [Chitinophagaceae bacterium]
MSFAIETKELSYSFYTGVPVVNKVSLQVPQGSIYGFLGPNGAGKTTTIRLLAGMLLSDKNNIFINGQSLQKEQPLIFNSIGTLIESPSLYGHLTARENLKLITTLRGLPRLRIEEVLEIVGLSHVENKRVKAFSLGMKQRLGIAIALLPNPSLLILDEPANGLDPSGIIEIRELLIRLNKEEGKTIFVSSHLLHEIEKTCTHIGIIHKGVLRYQGSLHDIKETANQTGEVIFKIQNSEHWLPFITPAFAQARRHGSGEIIFPFTNSDEVAAINQQLVGYNIPVQGIQVRGGLEDWFMQLTQNNNAIS